MSQAALAPTMNLATHWIAGWVGPTASQDILEKNFLP
jgi:hypothetical protein